MKYFGKYNSMLSSVQWIIPITKLILSEKISNWCRLPYPNHPKGCPNYGNKSTCPPMAPHISEYFDLSRPMYIVHSEFNLKNHVDKMRSIHPEWSDLRCRCVLYWQSTSRKEMRHRVSMAVTMLKANRVTACPEAMGVNVFATAIKSGLKLERTRSIGICRHVSLIGYARTTSALPENVHQDEKTAPEQGKMEAASE